MKPSIAAFFSHDSSICIRDEYGNYKIFEFERLLKERFVKINNKENLKEILIELKNIIIKECNINRFDTCYHLGLSEREKIIMTEVWDISDFIESGHHLSHAACSYYQSPFNESLVISYDGGGDDGGEGDERIGYFNIYHVKNNIFTKLKHITYDLGTAYGLAAIPVNEITKTESDWGDRFLSFSGKIMGLVGYGNVREEWLQAFKIFYKEHKHVNLGDLQKSLAPSIGLSLKINSLSGQDSYDFAATSQKAFEEIIFEEIFPIMNDYDLPICLAGGCALNVILNQKLKEMYKLDEVFIPPNPSDCGLTFGMISYNEKPENNINLTYSGFPILDLEELNNYIKKYNAKLITTSELARLLYDGKIIGLMYGNSEVGPRALGNRSILCDPSFYGMKDTLNHKIKFREWFRPFAPIVRQKDASKYFEFNGDASFMSFSPKVKKEYLDRLPSIVHKDGTARLQTVTRKQNDYIYSLLTEFEKLRGIGCLLNTSFNIKGKPILTTIKDAIDVLETTQIDGVVIEGYLLERSNK